jgi:hypothetical protein
MRNLKNTITAGGMFLAGVVGHHYVSKLLDYKNELAGAKETELKDIAEQKNIESLHKKLDGLQQSTDNLLEPLTKLADKHVPEAQLAAIKEKIDFGASHCKTVKEILDKGPENLDLEYYRAAYRADDVCERATRDVYIDVKALVDSLNGKNNLVSNLNLDSFYEYLNSLGLLELSALYHLIVLTLICIISFNILSAVLGNEIIKYFNLEERFPKLAVFLRFRLKFVGRAVKYYLILSFSLIFFICIASILINILVLY